MGSDILSGVSSDLSMFEVNLNDWQHMVLEIREGVAYITVNGKPIFFAMVKGELGTLQGMAINSQRSARLDFLNIASEGKVILKEDLH